MRFGDYCKDKALLLLFNGAALLALSVFLALLGNQKTAIFLIGLVWILVAAGYLLADYFLRRNYFRELDQVLSELDQRYLIAEVMKPGHCLADRLYWEILRKSNKSVIEKIHQMEDSQKEYKEYVESWIHEVKTPITAAKLICENHKDEDTKRVLTELDEIENQVEKILYSARMEQVWKDYRIHPVPLRQTVLSAISAQKRHLRQSGISIDLDMEETLVSTDEKWVEFILKQIFSNSMKYKRQTNAVIRIYTRPGERQKSLVIEDNGWGVAREDVGRIFQKGFTGKNGRREGSHATGMGLYLCKRLCDKLGIGISCESEAGAYTRMILTFPDSDHNKLSGSLPKKESCKNER